MTINEGVVTPEDKARYRERGYVNEDMLPKTPEERISSTSNYFTLWQGSIHNIPNYAAVVGFLALGLSPLNTIIGITLGGLAVALFMTVNGHAGAKYGIPFAMHLRSTYGSAGSKLPGFLRGGVAAIAWFGVQTYTGAAALAILISRIWPGFLDIGGGQEVLGITIPVLICFAIFWALNMAVGLGGGGVLNKFTAVLSPIIFIVFGGMTIWAINVGGGIGAIMSYETVTSGVNPIYAFLIIAASFLGVWAAPGVSVADFTKDAESQKAQSTGQISGLFVGHLIFAIMSVIIIIGGTIHYGAPTSGNGVLDFIQEWDNIPAVIIATGVFLLTTISTNATGNILPAGYQLSALLPNAIDYKKGVWIAGIVSFLIQPWRFMSGGGAILVFLNLIGALLGPVAGVMVADYYLVNKRHIDMDELYYADDQASRYRGVNVQAYIATLIGLALSIIGQFVPALKVLSDVAWISGFVTAFIIYWLLKKFSSNQ
ncbi:cytosine permease [Aerococcaceae bacterium DSM 111020]|nr:cytosine permease [Aerococcaceae bacterium DSM 111020]